eukprot:scaffold108117_cov48-Phaeocystis_antarctica.AAC.1
MLLVSNSVGVATVGVAMWVAVPAAGSPPTACSSRPHAPGEEPFVHRGGTHLVQQCRARLRAAPHLVGSGARARARARARVRVAAHPALVDGGPHGHCIVWLLAHL